MGTNARSTGMRVLFVSAFVSGAFGSTGRADASATYSDQTLADALWEVVPSQPGGRGWFVSAFEAAGGNTGSCKRLLTYVEPAPSAAARSIVIVVHLLDGAVYSPVASGPIATIDYSEDAMVSASSSGGQMTGPAIRQGSHMYIALGASTGAVSGWHGVVSNGLTAASFVWVDPNDAHDGIDPAYHPDFSATAAPIELGFFRAQMGELGGAAMWVDARIDNVSISVNAPSCTADLNSDGLINTADLIRILARFGQSVSGGDPTDITGDGVVNTADLVQLLVRFGQSC